MQLSSILIKLQLAFISKADLFSQIVSENSILLFISPLTWLGLISKCLVLMIFLALDGLLNLWISSYCSKNCGSVLIPCPLTSIFPISWKYAYIRPVLMKTDHSNYHPITLFSCLSETFETILNRKFLKHLSKFSILSHTYYKFHQGCGVWLDFLFWVEVRNWKVG